MKLRTILERKFGYTAKDLASGRIYKTPFWDPIVLDSLYQDYREEIMEWVPGEVKALYFSLFPFDSKDQYIEDVSFLVSRALQEMAADIISGEEKKRA